MRSPVVVSTTISNISSGRPCAAISRSRGFVRLSQRQRAAARADPERFCLHPPLIRCYRKLS